MNRAWTIPNTIIWSTPNEVRKSWDRKIPYHLQFRDYFAQMIATGSLLPGQKLPTERALADQFSINRITVRQALTRMESEGMIFRENRRGWFVSSPRIQYNPTTNASFTESVTAQGRTAGTKVLSQQQVNSSEWESDKLGCAIGDPIFVINRLRTIDGRIVLVEQIYIKANRCPNLFDHALDHSMTDLLAEKYNILEQRSQINMRPTALSEVPAKALGVTAGTPSFYLSRAILDQHNEVVEFDQEFWRHDVIDICVSATGNAGGKTTFKQKSET